MVGFFFGRSAFATAFAIAFLAQEQAVLAKPLNRAGGSLGQRRDIAPSSDPLNNSNGYVYRCRNRNNEPFCTNPESRNCRCTNEGKITCDHKNGDFSIFDACNWGCSCSLDRAGSPRVEDTTSLVEESYRREVRDIDDGNDDVNVTIISTNATCSNTACMMDDDCGDLCYCNVTSFSVNFNSNSENSTGTCAPLPEILVNGVPLNATNINGTGGISLEPGIAFPSNGSLNATDAYGDDLNDLDDGDNADEYGGDGTVTISDTPITPFNVSNTTISSTGGVAVLIRNFSAHHTVSFGPGNATCSNGACQIQADCGTGCFCNTTSISTDLVTGASNITGRCDAIPQEYIDSVPDYALDLDPESPSVPFTIPTNETVNKVLMSPNASPSDDAIEPLGD